MIKRERAGAVVVPPTPVFVCPVWAGVLGPAVEGAGIGGKARQLACVHTHTHTRTNACSHTSYGLGWTHKRAAALTLHLSLSLSLSLQQTRSLIVTRVSTQHMRTYVHARTHIHTHTHTHTHTGPLFHTNLTHAVPSRGHTHTQTHTPTHIYTRARERANTSTHAHTCPDRFLRSSPLSPEYCSMLYDRAHLLLFHPYL